ncbi:MAG: FkbM family methyltransferase [Candidatus Vogelbacteria bacterium]|nr:FkbM family methyltransferase [Candidatus Vogelbacteria bacterium]
MTTLFVFIKFAELVYRPQKLQPIPGWYIGMLENERRLGLYRRQLKRIWERLERRYPDSNLKIKWVKKINILVRPSSELSRCLYVEGVYEPNEFYFLEQYLKPGMTFIDVGANNGWFSLFASRLVGGQGQVLAIEPSRREVAKIYKNLLLNHYPNVRVYQLGLSDHSGEAELLIAEEYHEGHNTFGRFVYQTGLKGKERVAVDTLDNLVKCEKIEKVNLIKIDSEGSEFLVLRGADQIIETYRPLILTELFDRSLRNLGNSAKDILGFFKSRSYGLYTFSPNTGRPEIFRDYDNPSAKNIIAVPAEKDANFHRYTML